MIFDDFLNFAYGTIGTPPSPAASGTTFTLSSSNWPVPPFQLVVWPQGVRPLATNAEIIRVTGMSGASVTSCIRGDEGSTPRSITAGMQASAAVTARVLENLRQQAVPDSLVVGRDTVAKITDPTNTTQVAAALTEAMSQSSYHIVIPPGDHYIPQSFSGGVSVEGQKIIGAGKRFSRLLYKDGPGSGVVITLDEDGAGVENLAIGLSTGQFKGVKLANPFVAGTDATMVLDQTTSDDGIVMPTAGTVAIGGTDTAPVLKVAYTGKSGNTLTGLTIVAGRLISYSAGSDIELMASAGNALVKITNEMHDPMLQSVELFGGDVALWNHNSDHMRLRDLSFTDSHRIGWWQEISEGLAGAGANPAWHPDLGKNQFNQLEFNSSYGYAAMLWNGQGGLPGGNAIKVNKYSHALILQNLQGTGGVTVNFMLDGGGFESQYGTATDSRAVILGSPNGTANAIAFRHVSIHDMKIALNSRTDVEVVAIYCDDYVHNLHIHDLTINGNGTNTVGIYKFDGDIAIIDNNDFYGIATGIRKGTRASRLRVGRGNKVIPAGSVTDVILLDDQGSRSQSNDDDLIYKSQLSSMSTTPTNVYEVKIAAFQAITYELILEGYASGANGWSARYTGVFSKGSGGTVLTHTADSGSPRVVGTNPPVVTLDVSVVDVVTIKVDRGAAAAGDGQAALRFFAGHPSYVKQFNNAVAKSI